VLVGLLVAVGLAIDGGTGYLERRRMQNAADAAALAGARRLSMATCDKEQPAPADDAIYAAVVDYATRNGVRDAGGIEAQYVRFAGGIVVPYEPPVLVGNGIVPDGAVGVSANSTISRETYFVTLAGQERTGGGGAATAVTAPPRAMGGVRPFGVPVYIVPQLGEGGCFTLNFKNCEDDKPDECWIKDDYGNLIGQHRNWLNLNHLWNQSEKDDHYPRATGMSANAEILQIWMDEGWDGKVYADCFWSTGCRMGDYIHAKPGTDSSIIGYTPIDTPFSIPLFDIVPYYHQIPPPKPGHVPQGADFYYHIVGFATVEVGEEDAAQGAGTIRGCISQVITGLGTPGPNAGYGHDPCRDLTMVVTLWD
jgi:hypothetical protein